MEAPGSLSYLINSCIGAIGLVAFDANLERTVRTNKRGSESKSSAAKTAPFMGAAVVATAALLALPAAAPVGSDPGPAGTAAGQY